MRVLILTSSTGGGHNMRARAFQEWAQATPAADLAMQLHRPLEASHEIYAFGVWLYNWIQRTAPRLHHVYYNFLEVVPVIRSPQPLGASRYRAVLEEVRPDVVLSVHDSLNHVFFDYARTVLGRDRVRCVTYCGELFGGYGFSRHWVNPAADLFIGAVPETCEMALRLGMPAERTRVGGFMLRKMFYESAPVAAPEEFTLLLAASNRGANNHLRLLEALRQNNVSVPVMCLCGKNAAAAAAVQAWADRNPAQRVQVLPHNSDVAAVMRRASAIVARPGTGTTSEAIVSGCPLIFNGLGGIMPQEWITVKYARRHQLGETVRRPNDLARIVKHWQRHPEIPAAIHARLKSARPAAHPRDVLSLLFNQVVTADSSAALTARSVARSQIAPAAAPHAPETIHPL